ncbi:phosphoglycolate phosphatase [Sphingomonas gellani]|uniref:Phosphoglycolate phosphatase n=1 Tax=Sphingomonas gellani TaxID=1166340 RepID=A0A1H8FXM8_9SPHN|nr:HAD-IA family hydrolase [Sphingomonas gellani]SEN35838.1 phosphoglycolate phosphatase [Sphingomonas gellani]
MTQISPDRFPFAIVGFDLDGTLLDTSGDLAAAVNHALSSAGRPTLTTDQVRPMIGGGSRHMLAQGMAATGGCSEEELDVLQRRLLDYYEANIAVETRPFPGCLDALDTLAGMGVRLAVVTNKLEGLARTLLDALHLSARFDTIIGGDTMGPGRGKPAPDPVLAMVERCGGGTAAFVGDSIYDVRSAQAAGLPVVACSFGFLQQPVETLGADAVIDGYDDLIPTLRTLGARP